MKYNFDEIIERRHTNAMNTDGFRSFIFNAGPEARFAYADDEFIRMWVADMEFAVAPEIRQAIKDWTDKRIFGYTQVYDSSYYDALSAWCQRRYDWTFPKEELCYSTGVVGALFQLVEILCEPGDKVMTVTPAYGQFGNAAKYNSVEMVQSPLIYKDNHFSLDFADLEEKARDPKMKVLIWCSPHNPSGRVWTREELERLAEIVTENDLWIISDEIHCDLLRVGQKHIPTGKILTDYPKLITCMAPSKAFNIAGLMLSAIIIRDPELRKAFKARDKNVGCLNPFSIAAHLAAYTQGEPWLEELQAYLDSNFALVKDFFNERLPEAGCYIPEATYLAWVDLGAYISDVENIPLFFANEAGVLLEGGDSLFVGNADGFVRLNLAMPQSVLQEGLERIAAAVKKHAAGKGKK